MKEAELIEAFSLIHKEGNCPPLAGKIIGLFFVSNEKYLTFEEIMDGVKASKGATSKSLNFLIAIEEIQFVFSVENKRKRLFFFNIGGAQNRLDKLVAMHKKETTLLKEILPRRNADNIEMNTLIKNIIAFNEDVLHFISAKIAEHFEPES